MAKIAVLMTDLFEDVEYTEPAKAFEEAGHELKVISFEKGEEVKGKQGNAVIKSDKGISDVSPHEFDAMFIPGGFSPDQLRADDRFVQFAKIFYNTEKPIMAICHGPQLLITADVLEGRDITGYKSIQVDLENAGAKFHDQEVVVCNGNLVSSRNPDDIPAFIRESLNVLH